ncbi:MAG: hypothetical protein V1703_01405 [Candidatus Altiarchaeota archaeon]
MALKPVDKPEMVYTVPPLQPSLFASVESGRLIEDGLRAKASGLEREGRLDILLGKLNKFQGYRKRVVDILERVAGDDDAFKITLDTLAYARRRDPDEARYEQFSHTLERIEHCMKGGSLPLGKMQDLLGIGVEFTSLTSYFDDKTIQKHRNWINGGGMYVDFMDDFEFPKTRGGLLAELHGFGASEAALDGGSFPIEDVVDMRVLKGMYAGRKRNAIAEERRRGRFLNTNDW